MHVLFVYPWMVCFEICLACLRDLPRGCKADSSGRGFCLSHVPMAGYADEFDLIFDSTYMGTGRPIHVLVSCYCCCLRLTVGFQEGMNFVGNLEPDSHLLDSNGHESFFISLALECFSIYLFICDVHIKGSLFEKGGFSISINIAVISSVQPILFSHSAVSFTDHVVKSVTVKFIQYEILKI